MIMTAVVIVNYIKYEDTIAAIDSVLESATSEDYRIIVVDNGSTNDSYDEISRHYGMTKIADYQGKNNSQKSDGIYKNLFSDEDQKYTAISFAGKIALIEARENNGYCAGNNIGIRYALEELGAKYIWILNPDTIVKPYTFENYLRYASMNPEVGIVGADLIFYPDSEHMQAFGGGRFGRRKSLVMGPFNHEYKDAPVDTELPDEIELDVAIGASMFVRSEVFEKIGLMNEDYFLYSDENEFCLRAKKAGYRITAIRGAVVYHKEGYRQDKQTLMAEYYITRNSLYMVKELYPKYFPVHYFFTAVISSDTIRKIFQGRFDLVKMKYRGIRDYRRGIKGRVSLP